MKEVLVRSSLDTGLLALPSQIQSITLDNSCLGQGGFGEVWRVRLINGQPCPPLVVKILFDNGNGVAQRGFATIQEFQQRLKIENLSLLQKTGRNVVQTYSALVAVPQVSFEGTKEGKQVVGYLSTDLGSLGLEDFGRLLEDETKVVRFQSTPAKVRLALANQLVKAFQFLSSRIRFIHADIKADALFVDPAGLRIAIIDFDSGALARDPGDTPTTFGTRQDWLAPEIVAQLDKAGNTSRTITVDLYSDVWSVNIAIHYILFGCHPLFFLSEMSPRSIDTYFKAFQWPQIDPSCRYFVREYAAVYKQYVGILSSLPREVVERFKVTINAGYANPAKRSLYGQWETTLSAETRPAIRSFTSDRTLVSDLNPVRLSWDVQGADSVEISGIGDVTGRQFVDVVVDSDRVFELTIKSDSGQRFSKTIAVTISREPPEITTFQSDRNYLVTADPVRLTWAVKNTCRLELVGIGEVSGLDRYELAVRADTVVLLKATSIAGLETTAQVRVEVCKQPPKIHFFSADALELANKKPVELTWKVSNDAARVTLTEVGPVAHTASIRISQRRNCTYQLIASNAFGYSAQEELSVTVCDRPPAIRDFSAFPKLVRKGQATTFRWKVDNAETVSVTPDLGRVADDGALTVVVEKDTVFTLTCESYYGVTTSRRLSVRVLGLAGNRFRSPQEVRPKITDFKYRATELTPRTARGGA